MTHVQTVLVSNPFLIHTIRSATRKKTQDKHKNQDNVVILQEYSATTYSQPIENRRENSKLRETGGSK